MKSPLPSGSYAFNATAKTITFSGTIPAEIGNILHVANITRGVIYFQPQAGLSFSGTYASPVLTLAADTTGHSNTDKLLIIYDDGTTALTDTQLRANAVATSSVDIGVKADAVATTDTGTFSVIALIKRSLQNWTTLLGRVPSNLTVSSTRLLVDGSGVTQPVSGPLTDGQLRASAVPMSAASLPLPAGAATDANQTTGNASLSSIDGKTPALVSGRVPVDVGSAINVGEVEIKNDTGNPIPTSVALRTPTTTSVASSATSVTILASNASRRGFSIHNDSTSVLRLSFSTPATSANAFIVLPANSFLLLDQQLIVTGTVYGIWASANGTAQVTEYV